MDVGPAPEFVRKTKDGKKLRVRRITREDLDSAFEFWQALADERIYIATERVSDDQRNRWTKSIGDSEVLWVMAEVDGKMVGSLSLARSGNLKKTEHVRYLGMGVAKSSRGKGVGNSLMDYAIRWARRKKLEKIDLGVFATNKRAIRLYEKFGFVREGSLKREFRIDGKYVDEVLMGKFL